MATSDQIKVRIEALAREMCEEMGDVDESMGVCWFDAIENQTIEITNALAAELIKLKSADRPVEEDESVCPECGKLGQYKGQRARELLTRRGPTTIAEPKYYCPACRRAFFPDDPRDRG